MTSAPARTTSRTLARTASPPSHTAPGIPGQVTPHGPTPPPLGSHAPPSRRTPPRPSTPSALSLPIPRLLPCEVCSTVPPGEEGVPTMHRLIRAMLILSVAAPVVAAATAPAGAAFPGRNGLIAWSKVFFSRDAEIFVMRPNGSDQHQLTHNDRTDFDPAWSADGRKLAYASRGADADVWVINSDG